MFTSGNLLVLALFVLANLAAASSGAVFRPGAWYAALAKPPWTQPKENASPGECRGRTWPSWPTTA